jgi:4-amino-4-deoxy-L-arabinose transferase-like glycosyltransferase
MTFLSRDIGVTWDESIAYFEADRGAARAYAELFTRAVKGHPVAAVRNFVEAPVWRYHPEIPMLQRIVQGKSAFLLGAFLKEPALFRAGSAMLWVLMLLFLYLLADEAYGRPAAWAAAAMALSVPRLFGHGLIAATETSLLFTWLAAIYFYMRCFDRRWPDWVFGLVLGLGLMAKFQSLALLAALTAWGFLWRPGRALRLFAWGAGLGLALFFAFQPLYWKDPVETFLAYVRFNLHHFPIRCHFLGVTYSGHGPWYYAPVILGSTMPVPVLLLSLAGVLRALVRPDRRQALFLWLAVVPLLLMMMPNAPTYDGERLFVQAYPLWVLLAAGGFGWIATRLRNWIGPAIALLFAGAAAALALSHPHHLATYNALVGWPGGAERRGFESTYWLDSFTRDVMDAVNREVPASGRVQIYGFVGDALEYQQARGLLRRDIRFTVEGGDDVTHWLLYNRQAFVDPGVYRALPAVHETRFQGASLVKLALPPRKEP